MHKYMFEDKISWPYFRDHYSTKINISPWKFEAMQYTNTNMWLSEQKPA